MNDSVCLHLSLICFTDPDLKYTYTLTRADIQLIKPPGGRNKELWGRYPPPGSAASTPLITSCVVQSVRAENVWELNRNMVYPLFLCQRKDYERKETDVNCVCVCVWLECGWGPA